MNEDYTKLQGLCVGLDVTCKTQVGCTRARASLLQIKKLSDTLRKSLLTEAKCMKETRSKLEPKATAEQPQTDVESEPEPEPAESEPEPVEPVEPAEPVELATVTPVKVLNKSARRPIKKR